MRLNRFIAQASGLSRRAADTAIENGRVMVGDQQPSLGYDVQPTDVVTLDGQPIAAAATTTIMFNKPVGYVCSREGQGSKTVYDLLPPELRHLKPVGRLDKDSSGLLLLTNDGQLAQSLTHPSQQKSKTYEVQLSKPLRPEDKEKIAAGVMLEDGLSQLKLESRSMRQEARIASSTKPHASLFLPLASEVWLATLSEGRNRQIRRTFAARGYSVVKLHRTHFGPYQLDSLPRGKWRETKTML